MSESHDQSNGQGSQSEDEVMEQLIALGYVDPGAGSSVWQAALARFFMITGGVKKSFRKIFGTKGSAAEAEEDE